MLVLLFLIQQFDKNKEFLEFDGGSTHFNISVMVTFIPSGNDILINLANASYYLPALVHQ